MQIPDAIDGETLREIKVTRVIKVKHAGPKMGECSRCGCYRPPTNKFDGYTGVGGKDDLNAG